MATARVTGIGGFFFRADDPAALARWYEQHLGITRPPISEDEPEWAQDAGPTVFAAFGRDSPFFGHSDRQWIVNFRVADLDALVGELRGAGIEVEVDAKTYPNGRFAELADPEGNPIQLWEPREA